MWNNLPIVIKRNIRQRRGFGMTSSKKSPQGFDIQSARNFEIGDSPRLVSRPHLVKFDKAIVLEKYPDRSVFVVVLFDVSNSESLGSARTKLDANLELLDGFGRACVSKSHRLLILAFSSEIEYESKVLNSLNAFESAMYDIRNMSPKHRGTDHRAVFERAYRLASRSTEPAELICIMSDFLFPSNYNRVLQDLYGAADVITLIMKDQTEVTMPVIAGGMMMRDSETGETFYVASIDPYNPIDNLKKMDIDTCLLNSGASEEEYFQRLSEFFLTRADRR